MQAWFGCGLLARQGLRTRAGLLRTAAGTAASRRFPQRSMMTATIQPGSAAWLAAKKAVDDRAALPGMLQELFPFTPCPLFTAPVASKEEALELVSEHVPWLSKKQRQIPFIGMREKEVQLHMQDLKDHVLQFDRRSGRGWIHNVVKGKGAGKTRFLDELLQALLLDNHHSSSSAASSFVLPLPVTFGSNWTITAAEIDAARGDKHHKPTFVIAARMLSMFFAIPLKDASDLLARLPVPYNWDTNENMMEAVVTHITSSLQNATNHPVGGLLVLLDESSAFLQISRKINPTMKDPLVEFRNTLIGLHTTDLAHCGLLVSSMETEAAVGRQDAHRSIWQYKLQELDPQEVVEKIWLPGIAAVSDIELIIPAGLAEEDMALLATSFARIPLHVELYLDCLRAVIEHQGHPQVVLSKAMLCEAFDALLRQLQEPYAGQQTNRSAARQQAAMEIIVKGIILQKRISYDREETKYWLHNGFLTNNVICMCFHAFEEGALIPEASSVLATIAVQHTVTGLLEQSFGDPNWQMSKTAASNPRDLPFLFQQRLVALKECILSTAPTRDRFRAFLSKLTKLWLEIRLHALLRSSQPIWRREYLKETPTLEQLMPSAFSSLAGMELQGSSYRMVQWKGDTSSPEETANVLTAITVDEDCGLTVFHPSPGECFDMGLLIRRPDDSPYLLLFACDGSDLTNEFAQALRVFEDLQPACRDMQPFTRAAAVRGGSAAEALVNGNVAFINCNPLTKGSGVKETAVEEKWPDKAYCWRGTPMGMVLATNSWSWNYLSIDDTIARQCQGWLQGEQTN